MSGFRIAIKSALVATLFLPVAGLAQAPAAAKPQTVQLLFVQTAKSATLHQDGRLTLKGLSPTTLYFSDRPARIAGQALCWQAEIISMAMHSSRQNRSQSTAAVSSSRCA